MQAGVEKRIFDPLADESRAKVPYRFGQAGVIVCLAFGACRDAGRIVQSK
jgi:hypothetical protein